jgi:hypothetical protein
MTHLDGIDSNVCQITLDRCRGAAWLWVRENGHVVSAVQHRRRHQQNPSPRASRTIGIRQLDTHLLLLRGAGPRLGVASITRGCPDAGPASYPEVIRGGVARRAAVPDKPIRDPSPLHLSENGSAARLVLNSRRILTLGANRCPRVATSLPLSLVLSPPLRSKRRGLTRCHGSNRTDGNAASSLLSIFRAATGTCWQIYSVSSLQVRPHQPRIANAPKKFCARSSECWRRPRPMARCR